MKKTKLTSLLVILILCPVIILAQSDKSLFDRAKMSLFDKEWKQALSALDQLIDRHPDSRFLPQAKFYRAECLQELEDYREALKAYDEYRKVSENETFEEQALVSIINLCFELYQEGERRTINRVVELLDFELPEIQYYAAWKLSSVKDKRIAEKAVPVLKRMIREESDSELISRAKIALMRIDPKYLKQDTRESGPKFNFLKIKIFDKEKGRISFQISIPFFLAKVALDAIPDSERAKLRRKGYNIDTIIESLVEHGEILKIEDNEARIQIWIE